MKWTRQKNRALSDAGYVVCWDRNGDGELIFTAFGPSIGQAELRRQMKVRYERGERVPLERELLGCFRGPLAGDLAKMVCKRHWDAKRG